MGWFPNKSYLGKNICSTFEKTNKKLCNCPLFEKGRYISPNYKQIHELITFGIKRWGLPKYCWIWYLLCVQKLEGAGRWLTFPSKVWVTKRWGIHSKVNAWCALECALRIYRASVSQVWQLTHFFLHHFLAKSISDHSLDDQRHSQVLVHWVTLCSE